MTDDSASVPSPCAVEIAVEVPTERLPVPEEQLSELVARALSLAGFEGGLSLAIVDDARMQQLNRDFHACDAPTDVLAFPLDPLPGTGAFAAEVIVSLDTALREAKERSVEPLAEVLLYVVHGVLHLLGEDDHEPEGAARMHARTLDVLRALGFENDIRVS